MHRKTLQNIFSDRSSIVLRALLREPEKKWTTDDFRKEGVSFGLVSEVLNKAESAGYVERVRKGPESFTRLIRKDDLLKDWTGSYAFEKNRRAYYLYPKDDFPKVCREVFRQIKVSYALTLFSASRLISPYVKNAHHFVYLDDQGKDPNVFLKELASEIELHKLAEGESNVCLFFPFYKSSVFKDARLLRGFPVVSNLQLYLDLMTFEPGGREEAEHLAAYFKREGKLFV